MAAVELALLLPLLIFMLVATTDYARVFYYDASLDGCARNGALYGCRSKYDPAWASAYASVQAAALAEASNLVPAPTIAWTKGVDASGNSYIQVTASYDFHTLVTYPGIPSVVPLRRTVWMPITPDYPTSP